MVFYDRFISKRSRTHDQMVQATWSGKQNHAYGVTGAVWLQALVQGDCIAGEMFIID